MKTKTGKYVWWIIGTVWVAACMLYNAMPDRIATHWNAAGEVDGYLGKLIGLFLIPMIMLAVQVIFLVIPRIDPLRANIEKFKKQFEGFMVLMALFMAYLFVLTVLWTKGVGFSMNSALAPAFGALFYGIGSLLDGVKRNWFIGIRTPWTMSNDRVWDKTHALGGRLFKGCGIIALIGLIVPQYAILFMIVPVLTASVAVVVYSYVIFKKEK